MNEPRVWPTSTRRRALALVAVGAWIGGAGCGDDANGPEVPDVVSDPDAAQLDADAGGDVESDSTPLVEYTEQREPCADRSADRNLYWGDLHVHTAYSFDAYINDVRAYPADALAFAQGAPLPIPPDDTSTVRLDRPLDFAAVTDHAEYLAETASCNAPDAASYSTSTCARLRDSSGGTFVYGSQLQAMDPARFADVCDAIDCGGVASDIWRRTQQAADDAYDRSAACSFTAFVGYEYTSARNVSNLHRNVIFRNDDVPAAPVTYFDEVSPWGLWRRLREGCEQAGGECQVLVIPHNSNMSDGRMFVPEYPTDGGEDEASLAAFRAEIEPLVEIFQHKSASECVRGLPSAGVEADELCSFEDITPGSVQDCGDAVGSGGMAGFGCLSRYSFVRYALEAGLLEEERIGVNPYRLGIIASTDTHNGTAGYVEESDYRGHVGIDEGTPEARLARPGLLPGGITTNPGGLAGVWAVENSRDALFEAMRRREVFGTSGPRISVRFFAGYGLDEGACESPTMVSDGYAGGVPMGGVVVATDSAPRLVVQALRDPASAAGLDRVQIVKGWVEGGSVHERVVDVATAPTAATVDLDTCAVEGEGAASLCTTWTDPDFDPSERAFYYVRVLETPTCRWSRRQCLAIEESARPAGCADARIATSIQERAWTSPIWIQPAPDQ
ncbi:MAG: DUF3604 domain-containing protein [Myxococcales bacterium]|nr:DUF3604 domain-containing protein [Myxococcales bacterium]MCB9520570.1 DUF3604 domain-containing protein [Myxococcales bacterium]MCB9531493.1 DUF3604 domain-containing protein [Myxococcales bacterium]